MRIRPSKCRPATSTRNGVSYRGSIRGLVVDGRAVGTVSKPREFPFGGGVVTVNRDGAGLVVTLDEEVAGAPAGTKIVVADVSAAARPAARAEASPPTATATATSSPETTPTPSPTASAPTVASD